MEKLRHLDLFAGIGGFSLGLERSGLSETVAFCEIEKYCQKVLKKHWPDVPIYDDVRELTNERLESDGITNIGIITGGFPCQDISVAGNQKGIGAERSGLWSELCRIIGEVRPDYAIIENVTALLSGDNGRWFQRVLWDLSQIGYSCEWHCLAASQFGAHHHRDRVWIIAYPCAERRDGGRNNREERHVQTNEERGTKEVQQQGNKRVNRVGEVCKVLVDTNSRRFGKSGNECEQQRRTETQRTSETLSRRVSTRNARTENSSENVADTRQQSKRGEKFGFGDEQFNSQTQEVGATARDRPTNSSENVADTERREDNGKRGDSDRRRNTVEGERQAVQQKNRKANTDSTNRHGEDVSDTESERIQGFRTGGEQEPQAHERPILSVRHCEGFRYADWETEPDVGRVVDGLSGRVDRLKGLGNAIVPQLSELIGRAIKECMN